MVDIDMGMESIHKGIFSSKNFSNTFSSVKCSPETIQLVAGHS